MTATESPLVTPIRKIYLTNEGLTAKALGGLTFEQLTYRLTENNSPMIWIAAHIVQSRAFVLKLTGESFDTRWGSLFARGAAVPEPAAYPPVSEIAGRMAEVSAQLYATLSSLSPEQLAVPAPGVNFPNAETLLEQVGFLALHESYHVGQLAYIRKSLGFPGLVG
jgi:hypothetical protein